MEKNKNKINDNNFSEKRLINLRTIKIKELLMENKIKKK